MRKPKEVKQITPVTYQGSILEPLSQELLKSSQLTDPEIRLRDSLMAEFAMDEEYATKLVKNDEDWQSFVKSQKKRDDVNKIKMMKRLFDATDRKVEYGSMEQAQKAVTAWAILSDKVYGAPQSPPPMFNVAGKEIKINLGWAFKPYGKRKT